MFFSWRGRRWKNAPLVAGVPGCVIVLLLVVVPTSYLSCLSDLTPWVGTVRVGILRGASPVCDIILGVVNPLLVY